MCKSNAAFIIVIEIKVCVIDHHKPFPFLHVQNLNCAQDEVIKDALGVGLVRFPNSHGNLTKDGNTPTKVNLCW